MRKYIKYYGVLIIIAILPRVSLGVLTFDAQNFSQSIKNYGEQVKQMQELKQQSENQIAQYKASMQQLQIQRKNLKSLDFNTINDLYHTCNDTRTTLQNMSNINDMMDKVDKAFGGKFRAANANPFPDQEQNFLMRQHLQQNIEANRKAIQSLKVLEAYEKDQERTKKLVDKSQQATGQMQALQSSNQLAAIQIKELQDLKFIMARDLEQRSAAIAEENTAKVIAHQRFQRSMNKPKGQTSKITLPKLKK